MNMFEGPMSEPMIQERLNYFFQPGSVKYNVNGLFVFSWESDKLLWTKSGYIYEFEIKISRQDFRNDFRHKMEKHLILSHAVGSPEAEKYEQQLIEQNLRDHPTWPKEQVRYRYSVANVVKNKRMPNYFYYAVPEGMVTPDEVPDYAGLLYIHPDYKHIAQSFTVKRKAPQLHRMKYKDGELNLGEKFYYNWQSTRRDLREQSRLAAEYRDKLQAELDRQGHDRTWTDMERDLQNLKKSCEHWQNEFTREYENRASYKTECRMLRKAIKEMNPDFNFKAIEEALAKRNYR